MILSLVPGCRSVPIGCLLKDRLVVKNLAFGDNRIRFVFSSTSLSRLVFSRIRI